MEPAAARVLFATHVIVAAPDQGRERRVRCHRQAASRAASRIGLPEKGAARPQQHYEASRGWGGRPSDREPATEQKLETGSPASEDVPTATTGTRRTTPGSRSQDRDRADAPTTPAPFSLLMLRLLRVLLPRSRPSMRTARSPCECRSRSRPRMAESGLDRKPVIAASTRMLAISPLCILRLPGSVTPPLPVPSPCGGRHSARHHRRPTLASISLHGPNGICMKIGGRGSARARYPQLAFCGD